LSQKNEIPQKDQPSIVGFSSQLVIDKSRPSIIDLKPGRRIQINMWYPGKWDGKSSKMNFSDYIKVKGAADAIGDDPEKNFRNAYEDYWRWPISQGGNRQKIDSIFSKKFGMNAIMNLENTDGKRPVVLLMHGSAVDHAFLGEALAQQGYIAINVPDYGYLQKELNVNGIGMETEIRDYEFAIATLSTNPNIDFNKIVALGFSFGGQSAVGLACRNPNIKAVISYDGGIGSRFGARLINESPFCSTENITASLLHIYDYSYSDNYLEQIKSFVYSERTLVGINQINHWHFTSFGYLVNVIPELFGKTEYSKMGFQTILEITIDYLTSKVKNDRAIYEVSNKVNIDLVSGIEQYQPIKR
jgi:pimeloyl-ACP methyl ester carboxylesterase